VIAFREFSKRFGAHTAVSGLTLDVARGEVIALLGPNGSGKTTSIKAAAGLIRPSGGDVLIGDPLRRALEAEARRACAFLPQKVTFPDQLTGREVVEFYCAIRGETAARVDDALKHASLNGASRRPVGTYSGGMTQRLGLAVALAAQAPVLLLDEPTAALDPDGLCTFYGLVERRRIRGQTVLFSSHQMGDVERLADRLALLVGGRLVATFTARELALRLADRGVMKVAVDRMSPEALAAVRRLAPDALVAADQLIVPGPARVRPAVLDELRTARIEIRGLTAEEGRLDTLYRELVEGTSS
jgi:ABC-type multidrug transport system ATPase subunit